MNLRRSANPETKALAREMRRNPSPPEEKLWRHLRFNRTGYKFRRQSVLRGWIADFWCPSLRLVIEVDGLQHQKRLEQDRLRDRVLLGLGIMTFRVSASEVLKSSGQVARTIHQLCALRAKELFGPKD